MRPALGRDDFFVGPGNAAAVAWIDRWPDWPANAIAIHGPPGCGKTHLVHVFAQKADALILPAQGLSKDALAEHLASPRPIALEDCDRAVDERAILHLFNDAREKKRNILLTGSLPPARWPLALPDLRSRVAAIPAAEIALPDDQLFEAVIIKLFADRQLMITPDVVGFLVRRIDRSFETARRIVAAADSYSLSGKRPITIPLLKELLPA
ncbi:MAG: AAA family ATPase [Rhodobacteraceae bacterium]|nr:AAA family ATPase [Paracoccaceae bacterium]